MINYTSTLPPNSCIALGDIHGMYDLYSQFLEWVRDSGARVILCGDLIDRGPNDIEVLNRTQDLLNDPESWGLASFTAVQGNHERMFLNAVEGYGYSDWVRNGGDYENIDKLSVHAEWLRQLPYYVTVGDTLVSHAGVIPSRDPDESMHSLTRREDFVWNRGSFLTVGPCFEEWSGTLKKAVFGHTPKSELPYRVPNGICVDSAAYHTGVLTAYNITNDTFWAFHETT